MNIRTVILSYDSILGALVSLVVSVLLPRWVPNDFAKDLYSVGISVLSIIFAIFFAALAIIMSSSDDEFVVFLEEKGDYSTVIAAFRFTLMALFIALMVSIAFYAWATLRLSNKIPFQHFLFLSAFSFLFTYAMIAALISARDSIRYS